MLTYKAFVTAHYTRFLKPEADYHTQDSQVEYHDQLYLLAIRNFPAGELSFFSPAHNYSDAALLRQVIRGTKAHYLLNSEGWALSNFTIERSLHGNLRSRA